MSEWKIKALCEQNRERMGIIDRRSKIEAMRNSEIEEIKISNIAQEIYDRNMKVSYFDSNIFQEEFDELSLRDYEEENRKMENEYYFRLYELIQEDKQEELEHYSRL